MCVKSENRKSINIPQNSNCLIKGYFIFIDEPSLTKNHRLKKNFKIN